MSSKTEEILTMTKKLSKTDRANEKKGLVIVVSGPSGTGKGTLISGLMELDPAVTYSVSATTRERRYGETEGVSYYFKSRAEFEEMIANGEILEWDEFCGNLYGTPKSALQAKIDAGIDVILDITVKGARSIKAAFPEDSVTVFVLPPSIADLEKRIRGRKRESEEQLRDRIANAEHEIACIKEFEYVVVSDSITEAPVRLKTIIDAERQKVRRNPGLLKKFSGDGVGDNGTCSGTDNGGDEARN